MSSGTVRRKSSRAKRPPVLLRGQEAKAVIFTPQSAPLTLPDLHSAIDRTVERWVAAACAWDDNAWSIGEYRFVIFDIDVAPDVNVYVQIWSEPLEPVCCEVSSGKWNPPADTWMAGERSARVRAFGFDIGGRAENFERNFSVADEQEVAALARTIVDLLYAGFDYRGTQPLEAHLCYGSRAIVRETLEGFTPNDIIKMFGAQHYSLAASDDDEDAPVMRLSARGVLTTVRLADRVPDQGLFRTAFVSCKLPAIEEGASDGPLDEEPGGRTEERRLVLQFDGGVTTEWVAQRVRDWTAMIVEHQRLLRKSRKTVHMQPDAVVH